MDPQRPNIKVETDIKHLSTLQSEAICTIVDGDNSPLNKRLKLDRDCECAVEESNNTVVVCNIHAKNEYSGDSIAQLEIESISIKEEDISDSDSLDLNMELLVVDPLLPIENACFECNYNGQSEEDFQKHVNEVHSKKNTNQEELKCSECKYTTFKKRLLQQHQKYKHHKGKKLHDCPNCEFRTSTKKELRQHQRTEHPKRKSARAVAQAIADENLSEHSRLHSEGSNINNATNVNVTETNVSQNNLLSIDEEVIMKTEINSSMEDQSDVCEDMTGMNEVDNLLKIEFSKLSMQQQLGIKRLGPHQPMEIEFCQNDGYQDHFFSGKWFNKLEWLTVSESNKSLYCFYCLLFGGEVTWSKTGYNDIKHLSKKAKQHEGSAVHINNAVKFKTFGRANALPRLNTYDCSSIQKHNETVKTHRHILTRVIHSIKFCLTRELPFPDMYEDMDEDGDEDRDQVTKCMFNRQVFLGLLSLVEKFDSTVFEHIHSSTAYNYTSEPIQNELIECMYHVYKEQLKQDIEKANFVSIQVEQITSTTFNPQFAIIFRYMKDGVATERLQSFIEVQDRTADGFASAIIKELEPYNLQCKLIAQTFDGPITTKGLYYGVQNSLKEFFPHALYLHSYAHSLDHILGEACSTISTSVSLFFGGISLLSKYFLNPSRRTELLESECNKRDPDGVENKWDSVYDSIKSVYHNQLALSACFDKILDELGWSSECILGAVNFSESIEDRDFMFFLKFFYKVLNCAENLNKAFETRTSCGDIMAELHSFEAALTEIVEAMRQDYPNDAKFKIVLDKARAIITSEVRERLQATDHLITFSVVDPEQFRKLQKFPSDHLQVLVEQYPMLVREKLINELKVLYNNQIFAGVENVCALLRVLADNELYETFSELRKLIEIVLATPFASNDICSASKKLKEFKINDWFPEKLIVFATFNVHWDVMDKIPDFDNRVIDYFAKKTGRHQLLYVAS